jgi:antitoxin component YwqK of YwqJK toxin-antitoxin module
MKVKHMKWTMMIGALLVAVQLQGQGLVEQYDATCSCWEVKNHYDNGQVSSVHHENEARKKHGTAVVYNPEGAKLREEQWVNGRLDGSTFHYHPSGELYLEAHYENGKKKGTWTFLDIDGTPSQEITYTGNGADGVYGMYSAGVKYVEQTIEGGKVIDTKILHQELYDAVREEAAQTTK